MPADRIRLTREGAIATVLLDHPARRNALGVADVSRFRALLDEVDDDAGVRVLVITGSGDRTFCAGAALDQLRSGELDGGVFETLTNRIVDVRIPTICALNGSVYGGGAEIALCCDVRIGVRGMKLRVPAAALGVCYPPGGIRRYVQRLGLGVATRILVAAEEFDSEELLRVGYLSEEVDAVDLMSVASARALSIAALAPLAVASMKVLLQSAAAGSLDASAAEELVQRCQSSTDLKEGLAALAEGRVPRFIGG